MKHVYCEMSLTIVYNSQLWMCVIKKLVFSTKMKLWILIEKYVLNHSMAGKFLNYFDKKKIAYN